MIEERLASKDWRNETAATLVELQLGTGMIPWAPGRHGDPWNHVEAAMALSACGLFDAAERAYRWLEATQLESGAWHAAYGSNGAVLEARIDTNAVAYVATGLWHHTVATGDLGLAEELFAVVDRALRFVCRHALSSGAIAWTVDPGPIASDRALRAGCSSIALSLAAGASLARLLGRDGQMFQAAAGRVSDAVRRRLPEFLVKDEYAMDWYYPVLTGVWSASEAASVLEGQRDWFVTDDGVLCRSDHRWVTTAETAECAIAYWRAGRLSDSQTLLSSVVDKRCPDGSYLTGLVYPERSQFPPGEQTSYSSAAVLLACDALLVDGATAALFGGATRSPLATSTLRLPQPSLSDSMNRPEEIASR